MGVEQQVGLAAPLASALISPKPPSIAVASTTQRGGVVEAIPASGSRRMGELVKAEASIPIVLVRHAIKS